MPKTHPKPQTKKNRLKKKHLREQPKQFNLLKSKYYWIALTAFILVFSVALGLAIQLSLGKELLILASILSVAGLAFYIGFKSSEGYSKRATFFFVGASIVGFSIWAVMILSLNAIGITQQISSWASVDLFAITSLIICLSVGAIIGDLIGKNRDKISLIAEKIRSRID